MVLLHRSYQKKGGANQLYHIYVQHLFFTANTCFFGIKTMLLFYNLLTNNKNSVFFIGKVVSKKILVFHVNLTKTSRLKIVSYVTTSNTSFALDCCIVLQNDHLMDCNIQYAQKSTFFVSLGVKTLIQPIRVWNTRENSANLCNTLTQSDIFYQIRDKFV